MSPPSAHRSQEHPPLVNEPIGRLTPARSLHAQGEKVPDIMIGGALSRGHRSREGTPADIEPFVRYRSIPVYQLEHDPTQLIAQRSLIPLIDQRLNFSRRRVNLRG